jgi:hypothetical protein
MGKSHCVKSRYPGRSRFGFDNSLRFGVPWTNPVEDPMRLVMACLLGLGIVLTGCSRSKGPQTKEAVQAAIEAHLAQRQNLMLSNMTVEVQDVKFQGDTAEAQVNFRSKKASDLVVGVRYLLRRSGDTWKVESSSPTTGMGGAAHGGMGTSPHGGSEAAAPPSAETPGPQSSH